MELPVQLSFFRKLELWQELRRQDRNFKDSNMAWKIEKDILRWASTGHNHLGTPLKEAFLWDQDNQILESKNRDQGSLIRAMENLVQREFAVPAGGVNISADGIKIIKEGLLMGEVIADTQGTLWHRVKYPFFYYLTWLTVFAGVALLLQKFIIDMGLWSLLKKLSSCLCRGT
jgi:hypothetical protein